MTPSTDASIEPRTSLSIGRSIIPLLETITIQSGVPSDVYGVYPLIIPTLVPSKNRS